MNRFAHGIAHRFSSAAASYDEIAVVQKLIAGKTMALIPGDLQPARILDIGCGSGQLTGHLAERFPNARIDAVDIAPAMIAEARRRVPYDTIRWITGDLGGLDLQPDYDLVASSSSLHWIDPPDDGLLAAARCLAVDGLLAVSILCHGTLRELHEARGRTAPDKAPTARMLPPRVWIDRLRLTGFDIVESREELEVQYLPSVDAVLAMLQRQGVTGGHLSHGMRPLTRSDLRRIQEYYETTFRTENGIPVSYHPLYIVARLRRP